MSQQAPKKVLTELGFTKLAVPAHSQTTGDRVRAILQSESLTGVFLIGDNPRLQAELDDLGIRVNVLGDNETVPNHVFMLEEHQGFWGSVNLETGVVRDVDFAMDSVGAVRALLGHLYPEFRHEYAVRPVAVQVMNKVSPAAGSKQG
jgi:hypothetical protein